jgi:kynurenine formamidase
VHEDEALTKEAILRWLHDGRNWERWGRDDQKGTVNLITPERVARAARLVRTGKTISLSRDFPTQPGVANPFPAQHYVQFHERSNGSGSAVDYYGISYHGYQSTHIDALCHVWDANGLWGGRVPASEIKTDGTKWGGIEHWRDGILTRGVLLDVPRARGEQYVQVGQPASGAELAEISKRQSVRLEPGDAVVVYMGRDAFEAAHPGLDPYRDRPGLSASCLPFLRDCDAGVLCWDFLEEHRVPPYELNEFGLAWTVHCAIFAYGLAVVDNCDLGALARYCAEQRRYEFMLVVAPLPVVGGTGSPVNPIAVL